MDLLGYNARPGWGGCVVSASEAISLTEWQRKQLEENLDRLLPVLTAGMTAEESAEAGRAYSDLLRIEIVAFGSDPDLSSELFREMISERITESAGKSVGERRKQMRSDALRARVLTLDRMVVETSERAARGIAASGAAKTRIREAQGELIALSKRMERGNSLRCTDRCAIASPRGFWTVRTSWT